MGLDYNMDSRNAHFGMFDQMDNHHLYSNQLAELQSDISVLKKKTLKINEYPKSNDNSKNYELILTW